ncbi:MAG: Unknown protein [uncultured Thiotrichaceae bacterium]|uniref:Sulfotransferase domain-containing protein n=1 Tax=uncultured Thiotrichaceae bacterium TaxID=298394 RepID=A0A6S6TYP2_9GAMM|nr:MAG: Unknown protein [uncultured Thiotrichaceae bacterium]
MLEPTKTSTPIVKATLLSFPKSGRTWLIQQIISYLKYYFNPTKLQVEKFNLHRLDSWNAFQPIVPLFNITHDDNPHLKTRQALSEDKSEFNDDTVVLLVRDPRDVIVSLYFEMTRRSQFYEVWGFDTSNFPSKYTPISAFIRGEQGGIDSIIRYFEIWDKASQALENFICIHYEDMKTNTENILVKALQHWNLPIEPDCIAEAIKACEFERMQHKEAKGDYQSLSLTPADQEDPESFKVRRGKVGGYIDYLSTNDIAYLNSRCSTLPGYFARYR